MFNEWLFGYHLFEKSRYALRIGLYMTSLSYGRVFCLESQKIDGTEYIIKGIDRLCDFFYIIKPRSLKFGRRI